jgi:hydroxymethylpyrimidine/phosphomethylpyrimidine kinase
MNSSDDEIALKAISQVRALVAQNQKDEHKVLDVRVQIRHDQLDGIATDLGIEVSAIENVQREADSGTGDSEATGS